MDQVLWGVHTKWLLVAKEEVKTICLDHLDPHLDRVTHCGPVSI